MSKRTTFLLGATSVLVCSGVAWLIKLLYVASVNSNTAVEQLNSICNYINNKEEGGGVAMGFHVYDEEDYYDEEDKHGERKSKKD